MSQNLNLVLKKEYYEITGEPGKMYELRRPSKWIMSRLLNKDGSVRFYDFVELCSGYRKDRKTKRRKYNGFYILPADEVFVLPNGDSIEVAKGTIVIKLENEV